MTEQQNERRQLADMLADAMIAESEREEGR